MKFKLQRETVSSQKKKLAGKYVYKTSSAAVEETVNTRKTLMQTEHKWSEEEN